MARKATELNRSFSRKARSEEDAKRIEEQSLRSALTSQIKWDELISVPRAVILASSASGKTAEFEYRADTLNSDGKYAFYVRLEHLADQSISECLDPLQAQRFKEWLESGSKAYFFLDSLDEAKLSNKHFDRALNNLSREIRSAIDRCHVYVSSRDNSWDGEADIDRFERWLPYTTVGTSDLSKEIAADPVKAFIDVAVHNKKIFENEELVESKWTTPIYELVDLSDSQREKLAIHLGVEDVEAFLRAVKEYAPSQAARPGDLKSVAEYWIQYGRLGTIKEMLDYSITRQLTEPYPNKPGNILAPDEARKGAEILAGAVALTRRSRFKTSGGGNLAPDAVDPAELLQGWSPPMQQALMRLALFAPDALGFVRFQHRSNYEYLAASWLKRLYEGNLSRPALFKLLFSSSYGHEFVEPSLRGVVAWLALEIPFVMDEVISREPQILIDWGDSSLLSNEIRIRVLRSYAEKFKSREVTTGFSVETIRRFARPCLRDTIRELWTTNSDDSLKSALLWMIEAATIDECADLAGGLVLNETARDVHRAIAVQTLSSCNSGTYLTRLATLVVKKPSQKGMASSYFAKALFPDYLTVEQVLALVLSNDPLDDRDDRIGDVIKDIYEQCPDTRATHALNSGLIELIEQIDGDDHRTSRSIKAVSLVGAFKEIAASQLEKVGNREVDPSLIRLLCAIERSETYASSKDERLQKALDKNVSAKRQLFWEDFQSREARGPNDNPATRVFHLTMRINSAWKLNESDAVWLEKDLASSIAIEKRQIALDALFDVFRQRVLDKDVHARLSALVKNNKVLKPILDSVIAPVPKPPEIIEHEKQEAKWTRERAKKQDKDIKAWLKFRDDMLRDPTRLFKFDKDEKKAFEGLFWLSHWLELATGKKLTEAAGSWHLLREIFSEQVADAYKRGLGVLWRRTDPTRPERKGAGTTIQRRSLIAHAGAALEVNEGAAPLEDLSEEDIKKLAQHAWWTEEAYPEWAEKLVSQRPEITTSELKGQITHEFESDSQFSSYFLSYYSQKPEKVDATVADLILSALEKQEPNNTATYRNVIQIVSATKWNDAQRKRLWKLALKRSTGYAGTGDMGSYIHNMLILLSVNLNEALDIYVGWIDGLSAAQKKKYAATTIAGFFGRNFNIISLPLYNASVDLILTLIKMSYREVNPKDDAVHDGAYTPNVRDDAESGRGLLFNVLRDLRGEKAYRTMLSLEKDKNFSEYIIKEIAIGMAIRDAAFEPWAPQNVYDLQNKMLLPLRSGEELFDTIINHLQDLQYDFDHEDASSRQLVGTADDEDMIQGWLFQELTLRANRRIKYSREEKTLNKNMPDLIATALGTHTEVAIEIKHGGKKDTIKTFEMAQRAQLGRDYLRPGIRRYGIFVITNHRVKRWKHPKTRKPMSFQEVVAYLKKKAEKITENSSGPIVLTAIGIDASPLDNVRHTRKKRAIAKKRVKKPAAKTHVKQKSTRTRSKNQSAKARRRSPPVRGRSA